MYVCNRDHYGYLPVPLEQDQTLEEEEESFTHTLTEALSKLTADDSIIASFKALHHQSLLPFFLGL